MSLLVRCPRCGAYLPVEWLLPFCLQAARHRDREGVARATGQVKPNGVQKSSARKLRSSARNGPMGAEEEISRVSPMCAGLRTSARPIAMLMIFAVVTKEY